MYLPSLLEMAILEEATEGCDTNRSKSGTPSPSHSADNMDSEIQEIGNDTTAAQGGAKADPTDTEANEKEPLKSEIEPEGTSFDSRVIIDDPDSPSKKKSIDRKCAVVGVFLLLVILGGALAGILINKFGAKYSYNFQFANYYKDHMVLQRAPLKSVIWGYGPITPENKTIQVTIEGGDLPALQYTSPVQESVHGNTWHVVLDPIMEEGPFKITAQLEGQDDVITLSDVLFGDVWVCAGQNNMQYSVSMLENASKELEDLDQYSKIRLMSLGAERSNVPRYNIREPALAWTPPDKEALMGENSVSTGFQPHFSALCWLYGKELHKKLKYPIGLITATHLSTALEDWAPPEAVKECKIEVPHLTSTVWNAMLNPLLSTSLYGVVWYQGESDALEESRKYSCTFIELIKHWRIKLYESTLGSVDPSFYFGFVQLAPNNDDDTKTYGYPEIRWQQTGNYGTVPNEEMTKTFMAVAADLPDVNSTYGAMHPRHKQQIADRLVLGALHQVYGQTDIQYKGPFPSKYAAFKSNTSMVIHTDALKLEVRSNMGFEVCCSLEPDKMCTSSYIEVSYAPDRIWQKAPITSSTSNSITISYPECLNKHVVALRYLWRETPCTLHKCPIYDQYTGLPMPPYMKMKLKDDGSYHELKLEPSPLI